MKRLLFFLPALLLLWSSCKQTYFIAEDDVYSYPDPMALRPKSGDVQPEASLDGFVYNQENGNRATFYDPQNDLNQNHQTRETRVVNNYYYNDFHQPWGGGFYHPRARFRSTVFIGHGWNSWGHNPWGPSWGYNPWGPSWGMGWGYNSWGMNPWGMNPYGHFHQPWGGMYGPWGFHGGMGWNSWGHPGMGWNSWGHNNWGHHGMAGNSWGNNGFNSGGSGFGGNNNPTHFGPRPNISSSHNPNNLNVGRGNVSPIAADGQPVNQTLVSNSGARNSGRDAVPVSGNNTARTERTERQTLSSNSSPWNPRVDGRNDRNTNASSRPVNNNPGAVTVGRDNTSSSNANRPNSSSRPSGTARPRNASTPTSRPTSTAPSSRPSGTAPSSRPSSPTPSSRPSGTAPSSRPSSPAPSSRPSSPAPRSQPSSSPSPRSTPSSSPSSSPSRGGGSSGGSAGGGSRGGSSGGSSGGSRGGRP